MPNQNRSQQRGREYCIAVDETGMPTLEYATLGVLQDIRDELHDLNALLNCRNFVGIPGTLKAIHRKLPAKPKVKR